MINIAVFASGSGTNAENMINYFKDSSLCRISVVLSDKVDAYVLTRAANHRVPSVVFTSKELKEAIGDDSSNVVVSTLKKYDIGLIILAGFLLKVPKFLLQKYPQRIINIHPALLPAYGGKGMYGMNVHRAVVTAGEKESGITIHLADEQYDHGKILYQAKCTITPEDTPDTLAAKIHELEKAYPSVVEQYVKSLSL